MSSFDARRSIVAFGKVQSVEEEEKLLTEFSEWLNKKKYKIRVEVKNGKHVLSCPYFPPVTPWTEHSFLDVKNLELPRNAHENRVYRSGGQLL